MPKFVQVATSSSKRGGDWVVDYAAVDDEGRIWTATAPAGESVDQWVPQPLHPEARKWLRNVHAAEAWEELLQLWARGDVVPARLQVMVTRFLAAHPKEQS